MTADEAKTITEMILNPLGLGLDKEGSDGDLQEHTDNFLD